jgi:L-threonylcarbamoyladenylate synthase
LGGQIDLVIDSGPTSVGLESTVVDLTGDAPRVLRPGPISRPDLEAALGGERVLEQDPGATALAPASPGQMPVHYAPLTPAFRVGSPEELAGLETKGIALIVIGVHPAVGGPSLPDQFVLETPEIASRALYDVLHRCDGLAKAAIVAVLPPDLPEWRAVRDRLMRACRPLPASLK